MMIFQEPEGLAPESFINGGPAPPANYSPVAVRSRDNTRGRLRSVGWVLPSGIPLEVVSAALTGVMCAPKSKTHCAILMMFVL